MSTLGNTAQPLRQVTDIFLFHMSSIVDMLDQVPQTLYDLSGTNSYNLDAITPWIYGIGKHMKDEEACHAAENHIERPSIDDRVLNLEQLRNEICPSTKRKTTQRQRSTRGGETRVSSYNFVFGIPQSRKSRKTNVFRFAEGDMNASSEEDSEAYIKHVHLCLHKEPLVLIYSGVLHVERSADFPKPIISITPWSGRWSSIKDHVVEDIVTRFRSTNVDDEMIGRHIRNLIQIFRDTEDKQMIELYLDLYLTRAISLIIQNKMGLCVNVKSCDYFILSRVLEDKLAEIRRSDVCNRDIPYQFRYLQV